MAHGGTLLVSMYGFYALWIVYGLPAYLAFLLAIVMGAGFGTVVGYHIYKAMKRQGSPLSAFLGSFGVLLIATNLLSLLFGSDTKVISRPSLGQVISVFNGRISLAQGLTIFFCLILIIATSYFLTRSHTGLAIQAVAEDMELAEIQGLDVNQVQMYSICLGSILGAVSVCLYALDNNVHGSMGFELLLISIVVMIFSGRTWGGGLLAAGLLLAVFRNGIIVYFSSAWEDAITYSLLMGALVLRYGRWKGRTIIATD